MKLPAVSRKVREDMYNAQDEHCRHCGKWFQLYGAHIHHRRLRKQGGTNDPANLMLLDAHCHEDIHANRARSRSLGHIVPEWDDPAQVPVLLVSEWTEAA